MFEDNQNNIHTLSQSPLHNAGGNTRHNHFKLYRLPEIMTMNIEPNWLIEDYIEKETTGVLYGQSGSYKTFLALDWCLSVAAGQKWHGHDVSQGLVVYIAGEGNHGLQKRIKAWLKRHQHGSIADIPFIASNQRVAVRNEDELSTLKLYLDQINEPIKLIVFDTLRKCFGAGDENHSKDMGEFLDRVESLRQEYNTTCLIVHHTNKNKVIRGSNALESDIDYLYRLESKHKLNCVLHAEKLKDSDAPHPKQFNMNSVLIGEYKGKPINSLVLDSVDYQPQPENNKPQGIRGIVYDYIQEHCTEATTWTDVINDMLSGDFEHDGEALTKVIIRRALNALQDNQTPLLDFTKLDGQNAVKAVVER